MPPTASLLDRWQTLLPRAEALGRELLDCYSEPHRAYHNRKHLSEMLAAVDALEHFAGNVRVVRLAAWFHDAIYDPLRADNEERSAQLAADRLGETLAAPEVAEVARLVRLTAKHRAAPDDPDGAVLCDADLAILAADRERYAEYVRGIRAEYAAVDDDAFRAGRRRVLTYFLGLDTLFATPLGRDRWQPTARANLGAELDDLGAPT